MRTATIADVKRRKGEVDRIKEGDETTRAAVIRSPQHYFREGVTFSPTGFYSPSFRLGCGAIFGNKGSTIFLNGKDAVSLLGVLASIFARYLLKSYLSHTVETGEEVLLNLPLPDISVKTENKLKTLVSAIIEKQKANQIYPYHLHEQKEIDALIYELYSLTANDIREVEIWYCRRYQRLAEAQGFTAEVKAKYADYFKHCELLLSKPPSYWASHPIRTLIAGDESHTLDFKASLNANLHDGTQNDKAIHSTLKTIAAFLNSDGGTVLIGVKNSGEIIGIAADLPFVNRNNADGFQLKLRQAIKAKIEPDPRHELVEISFESLPEGQVCRVDVKRGGDIFHLDGKIYVRDGNSSEELKGIEITTWKRTRR